VLQRTRPQPPTLHVGQSSPSVASWPALFKQPAHWLDHAQVTASLPLQCHALSFVASLCEGSPKHGLHEVPGVWAIAVHPPHAL
jgi:hypothetical protein